MIPDLRLILVRLLVAALDVAGWVIRYIENDSLHHSELDWKAAASFLRQGRRRRGLLNDVLVAEDLTCSTRMISSSVDLSCILLLLLAGNGWLAIDTHMFGCCSCSCFSLAFLFCLQQDCDGGCAENVRRTNLARGAATFLACVARY